MSKDYNLSMPLKKLYSERLFSDTEIPEDIPKQIISCNSSRDQTQLV